MTIQELLELGPGSVIELDKIAGEALDILVNNRLVARGEAVVVNDKFGVRITDIVSPAERIAGSVELEESPRLKPPGVRIPALLSMMPFAAPVFISEMAPRDRPAPAVKAAARRIDPAAARHHRRGRHPEYLGGARVGPTTGPGA